MKVTCRELLRGALISSSAGLMLGLPLLSIGPRSLRGEDPAAEATVIRGQSPGGRRGGLSRLFGSRAPEQQAAPVTNDLVDPPSQSQMQPQAAQDADMSIMGKIMGVDPQVAAQRRNMRTYSRMMRKNPYAARLMLLQQQQALVAQQQALQEQYDSAAVADLQTDADAEEVPWANEGDQFVPEDVASNSGGKPWWETGGTPSNARPRGQASDAPMPGAEEADAPPAIAATPSEVPLTEPSLAPGAEPEWNEPAPAPAPAVVQADPPAAPAAAPSVSSVDDLNIPFADEPSPGARPRARKPADIPAPARTASTADVFVPPEPMPVKSGSVPPQSIASPAAAPTAPPATPVAPPAPAVAELPATVPAEMPVPAEIPVPAPEVAAAPQAPSALEEPLFPPTPGDAPAPATVTPPQFPVEPVSPQAAPAVTTSEPAPFPGSLNVEVAPPTAPQAETIPPAFPETESAPAPAPQMDAAPPAFPAVPATEAEVPPAPAQEGSPYSGLKLGPATLDAAPAPEVTAPAAPPLPPALSPSPTDLLPPAPSPSVTTTPSAPEAIAEPSPAPAFVPPAPEVSVPPAPAPRRAAELFTDSVPPSPEQDQPVTPSLPAPTGRAPVARPSNPAPFVPPEPEQFGAPVTPRDYYLPSAPPAPRTVQAPAAPPAVEEPSFVPDAPGAVPGDGLRAPDPIVAPKTARRLEVTPSEEASEAQVKMARIASRKGIGGLKGFCPVALRDSRELVDARPEFSAVHNGRRYFFSSAEAQAQFESDPDNYAPVAAGNDVVHLMLTGEQRGGSLDHAAWFRGRLYLFASAETMETFVAAPSIHARAE